jgi:hypothetical protein
MKHDGIRIRFSAALPSPCAQGRVPSGRRLGVRVASDMRGHPPATRITRKENLSPTKMGERLK